VTVASALAIAAACWGVLMAISPLLQIRRMMMRHSSEDVSIGYWVVLIVGFGLWLAYGLSISNAVLIIPNLVAFLVGVSTIAVAAHFRS
jgi:uncharacterized protein with PQ loop repeat